MFRDGDGQFIHQTRHQLEPAVSSGAADYTRLSAWPLCGLRWGKRYPAPILPAIKAIYRAETADMVGPSRCWPISAATPIALPCQMQMSRVLLLREFINNAANYQC